MEKTIICADCGHFQDVLKPCEACKSGRTVFVAAIKSLLEAQLGPDWWEKSFGKEGN